MNSILVTVQVVVDILVLSMLMVMVIKPREFFFNPSLRLIELITSPILKPLRKIFRPTLSGWDYTPVIAIGVFLSIQTVVIRFFSDATISQAIVVCLMHIIGFITQFIALCVIVSALIPEYTTNPLSKFFLRILHPFMKMFSSPFRNRVVRVLVAFVGFILMTALFEHFLHAVYLASLPDEGISVDVMTALKMNTFVGFGQALGSGALFLFSLLNIVMKSIAIYHFIITLLVISCILSWTNMDSHNSVVQFVYSISEPILIPFRRFIPPMGGMDLSPIAAILLISVIGRILLQFLAGLVK